MKVIFTEPAEYDMEESYIYIAKECYAPRTAANIVDKIEKTTDMLEFMPEMYPVYDKEPWRAMGIRIFYVKKYRVLYTVNYERKTVYIIRIIPAGMDIDRALQETDFEEIT